MHLTDIRRRIEAAEKDADRAAGETTLVAVTKGRGTDEIGQLLKAGQRHFGENRVQEAMEKWPALRKQYPDIRLHMIGQLQSNKAQEAVALFDVIETVDRESLARALGKEMQIQDRRLPCLLQVNTGEEPQKGGISPGGLAAFHRFCRDDCKLDVQGLMCIPPVGEEAAFHFALLRQLAAQEGLSLLSMGMSQDFETAIRWGSTQVRVGSALFDQEK